jgi:hypothetical protein
VIGRSGDRSSARPSWIVALVGGALLAGCASDSARIGLGFESSEAFLIDISVNESFTGTTRYVLVFTPRDRSAWLYFGGLERGTRRIPADRVREIRRFVEENVVPLATLRRECEDCTTYEIAWRIGPRVGYYSIDRTNGIPDPFKELFDLLGIRNPAGAPD